jgi:hypothetical protein
MSRIQVAVAVVAVLGFTTRLAAAGPAVGLGVTGSF